MTASFETTVHDMKTHFSQYSSRLLSGELDEIVVKNRSTPILRVVRYEEKELPGLAFGIARERGHAVVAPDWKINDGDEEIAELFKEYLQ